MLLKPAVQYLICRAALEIAAHEVAQGNAKKAEALIKKWIKAAKALLNDRGEE